MSVQSLSQELVIFIHDRLIKAEGGLPGTHLDKLEGALSRVDSMIYYERVGDIYEIAAQYGVAIAQGHPFNDANKRTSMACMLLFLRSNHIICRPPNDEIPDFIVSIAEKKVTRTDIAEWLKKYSRRSSSLLLWGSE